MIDLIVHHPSFDKNKSKIINALIQSIKYDKFEAFKFLLGVLNDDVNICDSNGLSLLYYSCRYLNVKVLDYIINAEKFDSKKSNILESFITLCSNSINLVDKQLRNNNDNHEDEIEDKIEDKIEDEIEDNSITNFINIDLMNKLCDFDKTHDHLIDFNKLLPNGKSFFTSFHYNFNKINKIVNFLLDHGADPNTPDGNDVFPLEKAIDLESVEFVRSLIDSNKINFSLKIPVKKNAQDFIRSIKKYTTYLHLATDLFNPAILAILLEKSTVDVNITDDLGNTALMEACLKDQKEAINLLFQREDLDYLHRNFEGNDALSLINKEDQLINSESPTSKDTYFKLLNE